MGADGCGARVTALGQTWQVWSKLGGSLVEAQCTVPTRCTGWDVACLYAHHSLFPQALNVPAPRSAAGPGSRPLNASEVLRSFNAPGGLAGTAASAIRAQVLAEAACRTRDQLVEPFRTLGPTVIGNLRSADPDLIVAWPGVESGMALGEALRIVVPEVTVHLLDVQRALDRPPAMPEAALACTVQLLAEVASAVDLIEAATGRSPARPFQSSGSAGRRVRGPCLLGLVAILAAAGRGVLPDPGHLPRSGVTEHLAGGPEVSVSAAAVAAPVPHEVGDDCDHQQRGDDDRVDLEGVQLGRTTAAVP
jgi:hypothetical protein